MHLPPAKSEASKELHNMAKKLRFAGLRPTPQRLALGLLLFRGADRHFTAEQLHAEALAEGHHVSLATIYNTLHHFVTKGLVRELAIDGSKTYFDTNTAGHSHFYVEDRGVLIDIPRDTLQLSGLPAPPSGTRISHIDVIVRLKGVEPKTESKEFKKVLD